MYDEHHPEETRAAVIEDLSSIGFDVSRMNPKQPIQWIMDGAFSQIGSSGVNLTKEGLRARESAILDEFDMKAYSKSAIKPEAAEVVDQLKSAGFLLGLLTNSGSKVTRLALERYRLQAYFDSVITRDDVGKMKPSGEGLRKIAQLLNVDVLDAVYVGDSWVDVVAAKESGMPIIAVEGGMSNRKRLLEYKPEKIISSLEKLPGLFAGLSKGV